MSSHVRPGRKLPRIQATDVGRSVHPRDVQHAPDEPNKPHRALPQVSPSIKVSPNPSQPSAMVLEHWLMRPQQAPGGGRFLQEEISEHSIPPMKRPKQRFSGPSMQPKIG